MTELSAKKLAEVLANDDANEKLSNADSVSEMVSILNGYGVEIEEAEINEILKNASVGELSEDSLDAVSGGGLLKKAWGHIKDALNGFLDGFLGHK